MIDSDRFVGCLLGQAVGDAMGFVVEGYDPKSCATYVRSVLRPRTLIGLGRGFPLGQYSDDTQLARELAESLVVSHGLDPADYARRVAALFVEGRVVGRGRATESAALRIAAGVPWDQAGTPAPSAGNGSAMRVAPVGLLFAHDPETMIRAAHDSGRVTHADPRCSAGAIAIAGAVALAARDELGDHERVCATLAGWVAPFDRVLADALRELPCWLALDPTEAADLIAKIGGDDAQRDGWHGISPFVTPSVLWSLYAALAARGDYWDAICRAIEPGGDVDTTAAMAGAIAGAAGGAAGVHEPARRLLTDRGTWGEAELAALARELHALHLRLQT